MALEALPKDVPLSKEVMGAVLYFLGALTGSKEQGLCIFPLSVMGMNHWMNSQMVG